MCGTVFVLLATNHYGAGLSPDSVGYIGTARNIIKGVGVISYDGSPLVVQPPLYPAVLAIIGKITGTDPLFFAHIVNAFLFGAIVYFGGLFTFKYLSSFPTFACIGTLAFVFSIPLFYVSGWAWSEPLFINFLLLGFIFAKSYCTKIDITSLIIFSSSLALASITRYIGVILLVWGGLIILIFCRDSIKKRITHIALFILISALPVGLWLIRNYAISSTLFGSRAPSAFALSQNLSLMLNRLLSWYLPGIIVEHRSILLIVTVGVGSLACLGLRDSWQSFKIGLRQISPIILFVLIYTVFLVISSTIIAYDQLGNRLLSPIYVPLTLLLLIFAQAFADLYRKHFSQNIVNSLMIIGIALWLVYPIRSTVITTGDIISNGQGYSDKSWKESETVQYLHNRSLETEYTFYTNAPEAIYILGQLSSKMSLARTSYNSPEMVNDLSRLKGSWPEESNACLIWFEKIRRRNLFTIDELQTIANIDLIAFFEDGEIYAITRK